MFSHSHTGPVPAPDQPQDRAEVVALRKPAENLANVTLSFIIGLREAGVVIPMHLRAQRHLVLVDGGLLDLAIDRAWPTPSGPESVAVRNAQRLRLVDAALRRPDLAEPLVEDEPCDDDPRVAADRGGDFLDALRDHPYDAEQVAAAIERRNAMQRDDDMGAAA